MENTKLSGLLNSRSIEYRRRPERPARARSGTSANRVLRVLDLFTVDAPVWTIDKLVQQLQLGRATAYRYVKALVDAGFLVPAALGGFVLGPRIIEFDRQIRMSDPLLQMGRPILKELSDKALGAQLLCTFYGDRVLCIHQELPDEELNLHMERGRPFPLFRGAPSRMILALLPPQKIKQLFIAHAAEIREAGLGGTWAEFRSKLKDIRNAGYCVSGDVDKKLIGVAAPIFRAPAIVIGSVCITRLRSKVSGNDIDRMAMVALEAASRITVGISRGDSNGHNLQQVNIPAARLAR
jgi:DNA-binding IclR family transcriptional regulator